MIYTGLNNTGEVEAIYGHLNGIKSEVSEVYGSIGYNDPIFYSRKTLAGTSPLTFKGLGQPLKDYHIFGETVQNGTPSPDYPVDVRGVGEYDYVSGKYYIPISGDTTELCDIHDIDRGTLRLGIAAEEYHVNTSYLVNVSTQTSTPNVILIPIKSATTYQVRFKTNNTALHNNDWVRVAFIDEFVNGAKAYDVYTWQRGDNGDKLRNDKEYYVTMINTNHPYLVVQSNLSPFGLFDYFSIQEVLSVIDIGSDPLYRIGDYADEIDFANQQIIRRIEKIVLKGREDYYSKDSTSFRIEPFKRSLYRSGYDCQAINNSFKFENTFLASELENEEFYVFSSFLRIRYNKYSTVNDFKTYLSELYDAGTPVILLYVLENQKVTSATIPQLTAVFGDNTLTVDTTVKPSAVSVTGSIKPTGYGQLLDANDVDIQDSTGEPVYIQG